MRKNLGKKYLFFLGIAIFLSMAATALASPATIFSQYENLKKKDPEVKNLITWEKLASQIAKNIGNKNKLQSYQTLAELFERIYFQRKFRPALSKAVYYSELLVRDSPGKAEAQEALLRLGDLRRNLSEGTESAKEEKPREIYVADKRELMVNPLIVIDPGHGGTEEGAVGVEGVLEKDVVLNISLMLGELLQERLHARTILTREIDQTLSLADRTKIANDRQADLFISIHANASVYKNLRGIETYYLDNTADKGSLKLAERENSSLGKSVDDLSFILSDFIQGVKLNESISLAHALQKGLHLGLSRYYRDVRDLGVKKAPFYVLVGAHMPCVLVEVSFIDHPEEGRQLISRRYQRLAALGIFQGLQNYFESRSKTKE